MRPYRIAILGIAWVFCPVSDSMGQTTENPPLVHYSSQDQSLMSGIAAVSLESHVPVGVVLGGNFTRLCQARATFEIVNATPNDALGQIARFAGYSVSTQNGVLVLSSPDLPAWELEALKYQFESFPQQKASMASLGVTLTGWIQMGIGHTPTFAASIMSSPDVKTFTLDPTNNATISEIADRIVRLPGGGLWIFRPVSPDPSGAADMELRVFSYIDDSEKLRTINCGPSRP